MAIDPLIIAAIIFVVGACFGSFITVASYRLPREEDIVVKPSYCPACKTTLKPLDMFPLLSWMFSGAKCRHCKVKIHWRYPAIEIVTGAVFVFLYYRYGISWQMILLALFSIALIVMIAVDLEHYMIPDMVHLVLLPVGIVYHLMAGVEWHQLLLGFGIGLGSALALRYGYSLWKKEEGLGWGDVKFLAVAGVWISPLTFVPFLFFSGLLGIATALLWRLAGKGRVFPFGPALALSLFLCVIYPAIPGTFWQWQYALIR